MTVSQRKCLNDIFFTYARLISLNSWQERSWLLLGHLLMLMVAEEQEKQLSVLHQPHHS